MSDKPEEHLGAMLHEQLNMIVDAIEHDPSVLVSLVSKPDGISKEDQLSSCCVAFVGGLATYFRNGGRISFMDGER